VATVEVESKVLGAPRGSGLRNVFFDAGPQITVRELIQRAVAEQVRDLNARSELAHQEQLRRFARQYLTEEEILALRQDEGRAALIDPRSKSRQITVEESQAQALEAFTAGRCVVFVDDEQMTELDQQVVLGPAAKVQFLRVLPLRGG